MPRRIQFPRVSGWLGASPPSRIRRGDSLDDVDQPPDVPFGIERAAARRIVLGLVALVVGAALAYSFLNPAASPPPAAIAHDPVLVLGREVFQERCVSCHGPEGRGDGPVARGLS